MQKSVPNSYLKQKSAVYPEKTHMLLILIRPTCNILLHEKKLDMKQQLVTHSLVNAPFLFLFLWHRQTYF